MPVALPPAASFDAAFARRAPGFTVRAEGDHDRAFLVRLFCACSPLAAVLPPTLLDRQAQLQIDAHHAAHPAGMRRIVEDGDGPIGRIFVDWTDENSVHGVDIAVLPDRRRGAAATAMLRAWLEVADAVGRSARLEVTHDNPARRLYRRLGFCETEDGPIVIMERPARAR